MALSETIPPVLEVFEEILKKEEDILKKRRAAAVERRTAPPESTQGPKPAAPAAPLPDPETTGLALSGGGIRSAAFCLGTLQGLDAAVPDNGHPQILDAIDYLSTVSGGGYIGCSLVAGLQQLNGAFPFESKLDRSETPPTQHLRDYANYLIPNGPMDAVVGAVVVLRGLLINALLLAGLILIACSVTVAIYSNEGRLGGDWVPGLGWVPIPFVWTGIVFTAFILVQLPWIAKHVGLLPSPSSTLENREWIGKKLAVLLLCCGSVAMLDLQSFTLGGLFDAIHLSQCRSAVSATQPAGCTALQAQTGWLGTALSNVGLGTGAPWASLAAAVAALGAFGTKLVKVAGATFGDRSWPGFLKHWGSRIAISIGALIMPLAIWAVYLSLCIAAICFLGGSSDLACCGPASLAEQAGGTLKVGPLGLAAVAATIGGLFLIACCFLPNNANSLHGFYRDRLSRTFLWNNAQLTAETACQENRNLGERLSALWTSMLDWLRQFTEIDEASALDRSETPVEPDRIRLSDLIPQACGGTGAAASLLAPYLIVNTAVNLEGSRYTNRRGRNADSFIFSPLHTGSQTTHYVATSVLQDRDPNLDLATAMAISGAAASANMGASTIRPLTFSLAVLNVRLGYWLPNPKQISRWSMSFRARLERAWPASIVMEAFGLLDERKSMVYLTDGGHFDNLGVYELLRRRCKIVIAVDAEADLPMNFESLIRLERCARIDLGVLIDLPWEDLRRWSRKITVDDPHGPADKVSDCIGPHVALGRIRYSDDDTGILIYIKSCITGDENDLIRDYRRRNPDFPHETTLDQFFTEEQFEVYRALGFHATHSFFSGEDRFCFHPDPPEPGWSEKVGHALKRLNVPKDAVTRIQAQQRPKTGTRST